MRGVVFAVLAAAASGAHAQAVHRCAGPGDRVTYQAAPCAPGERGREIAVSAPPERKSRAPTERERSQCDAALRAGLRDYDSAKFEGEPRVLGVLPTGDSAGTRGLVVSYWVNAKNGYGGYVGPKPFACYLALDGSGVLRLKEL